MHAVLATSTKVSMYRIFTRTAVRLLPCREVRKGTQRMCACAFYVKLPGFKTLRGVATRTQLSQQCVTHDKLFSEDGNR